MTADSASSSAQFTRALLDDLGALERLLDGDLIERGVRRIGAEQELFLTDRAGRPARLAERMLHALDDPRFVHELAQFNLEINLTPQLMGPNALRALEAELDELVGRARTAARALNGGIALTGILPTLKQDDLTLDAIVPKPRYLAMNDALKRLRGEAFRFSIQGIDRLDIRHENVLLEACTASFQVHFQCDPEEFVELYNVAQAISGPLLAVCVNSPLVLGRRLWKESRLALFEGAVDARSDAEQARGQSGRVQFGNDWLKHSILDIFREDIARYRALLAIDEPDPAPLAEIAAGRPPRLSALKLHNGTVFRWNRACYGENGKQAHLRIEHRPLPAGPTVLDEVANAALYFGLMAGLSREIDDVRRVFNFAEVKRNFFAAARDGLKSQQSWAGQRAVAAPELVLKTLLPMAERGLRAHHVPSAEIDRYLGVIEARAESQQTGARWFLNAHAALHALPSNDERLRTLTLEAERLSASGAPVHDWPLAEPLPSGAWLDSYRRVSELMRVDVMSVRADDPLELAAAVMSWHALDELPVESDAGQLLGLLSARHLLQAVARGQSFKQTTVRALMQPDPLVIAPDADTLDALNILRDARIDCLPVVRDGKLLGMLSERELRGLGRRALSEALRE
jgi:CBS domain-containing protein